MGCVGAFQIFTCSPRRWNASPLEDAEIDSFRDLVAASHFQVFCHMPYLPNLCSPDPNFYSLSSGVLTREVKRCDRLGIESLVVHFGSHLGTSVADGHRRLSEACRKTIEETKGMKVRILLENSAGIRNSVGSDFSHVRSVLDAIGDTSGTGVCFDTCHAFASGYDLRTEAAVKSTMDEFDRVVGKDNLYLIHLNDSKGELGGARDRHENIGKGKIGMKGLGALLRLEYLANVPVILETPVEKEGDDKRNLRVAKSLLPDSEK